MYRSAKISALFVCAFLLFGAGASYGFETPVTAKDERQALENLGRSFQGIGDRFKCNEFAWGNIAGDGKIAALEFIPPGDDVKVWKRMVTITVYSLPGKKDDDVRSMISIIESIQGNFQKAGANVIKTEPYKNKNEEPGLFVEYKLGEGAQAEHSAGVFIRTGETFAGFIQIQSKGKPLDPADVAGIKELLSPVVSKP